MVAIAGFSVLLLILSSLAIGYFYLLALASMRRRPAVLHAAPRYRFAIAIPAHNEEAVIGPTVAAMRQMDYPASLFDIHVVADHCSDHTAQAALAAGVIVHERNDGERSGKGAVLRWLFERILNPASGNEYGAPYDAVVIFDADTHVAPDFLCVMNACLAQGATVIQGQHRISNANDSWFASLTAAMFIVDNRFQNLGRSNLGWSAKNMGDSICLRADVLKRFGWGEGLTEDYQFRHRLLLQGVKIAYEPAAIGYGEAAISWAAARSQRARWLSGTYASSRRYAWTMLMDGLQRRDAALLDGAAQAFLPSFSTMTMIAALMMVLHVLFRTYLPASVGMLWALLLVLLAFYPVLGLLLERAPFRAYVAILLGPFFILWRTAIGLSTRLGRKPATWVRTARRAAVLEPESKHNDG